MTLTSCQTEMRTCIRLFTLGRFKGSAIMSQFQQPQYQQPGGYASPLQFASPPNFVPQANGGQSGEPLAQQVAKGIFPYFNRSEVVGQIFGMGQNTGIK